MPVKRDGKGRLVKGSAPLNPGGRPVVPAEIREAFLARVPAAVNKLDQLLGDKSPDVRLKAIAIVLDRALGKPTQAVTGADGGPLLDPKSVVDFLRALPDEDKQRVAQGLKGDG